MILILVEYFLNEDGRTAFSDWFAELQQMLPNFEGFQEIKQLKLIHTNPNRIHVLMRFETLAQLKTWARSDSYQKHLEKLSPYMPQQPHTQIFEES